MLLSARFGLAVAVMSTLQARGFTPSTKVSDEDHRNKQEHKRARSGRTKGTKHFTTTPDGRRVPAFTSKPGSVTIWPNISEHHPDKQPSNVGNRPLGRDALNYHLAQKESRRERAFAPGTMPGTLIVRGKRGPVALRIQNKAY